MGIGRPGLGAGHWNRPARPFVRSSGAARPYTLLHTRRRQPGCAPCRAAGRLPGGRERPTVGSGYPEAGGLSSPGFSAGGFHLRDCD